jgi:hypothetical protein
MSISIFMSVKLTLMALVRDIKHSAVMPGWNWTGWFVAIVDQHGHTVDKVPIADV